MSPIERWPVSARGHSLLPSPTCCPSLPGRTESDSDRDPPDAARAPATPVNVDDDATALAYFDDVTTAPQTLVAHLRTVVTVLGRLIRAGLKIKQSKSAWCRTEVELLGFVASEGGLKAHPSKVSAVSNYPVPRTVGQLHSFVQLASYYRRLTPDLAHTTAPLNELRKKTVAWTWEPRQQEAFETVRKLLSTAPTLAFPKFDRMFRLYTDAPGCGLGAVLSQVDGSGEERVLGYASRTLNGAERHYAPTQPQGRPRSRVGYRAVPQLPTGNTLRACDRPCCPQAPSY